MKTFSSLFFWFVLIGFVFTQRNAILQNHEKIDAAILKNHVTMATEFCATNDLHQTQLSENPSYSKTLDNFEEKWQNHVKSGSSNTENPPQFILPIVVHIIHENGDENIPNSQVIQAIEYLNDAFANQNYFDQNTGEDTQIQFCLAIQDPDKNTSDGINRIQSNLTNLSMTDDVAMKNLSRWNPKDYINIWVVKEICNTDGNCNVAGYAYLPYTHGSLKDGIVIEHPLFGENPGKTGAFIHEMGHYLGLYHTFHGGCTNVDCTVQGDRICDTPPDQSTAPVPCDGSINTCDTDTESGFTIDQNDMFWNYMDYGDINCFSAFTIGQIDRMHYSIEGLRKSLLISPGCKVPCPVDIQASFDFSSPNIQLGQTVSFINTSTFATQYEWVINGIFYSDNPNPTYTFNQTGIFEITLNVVGATDNCTSTITQTIEIVCDVDASFNVSNGAPSVGDVIELSPVFAWWDVEWTLNGNPFSTELFPSYTIPNEGQFEFCFTVSDGDCESTRCETLVVFSQNNQCLSPPFSRTFDFEDDVIGHCISSWSDGKFAIVGTQGEDLLITQTDFSGSIISSKTFEIPGGIKTVSEVTQNRIICGTTLDNRGFILKYSGSNINWIQKLPMESEAVSAIYGLGYLFFFANTTESGANDGEDFIMMKLEESTGQIAALSISWGYSSDTNEKLKAITFDGEFFYAATDFTSFPPGPVDYIGITKIRHTGGVFWAKRMSGTEYDVKDIHYENNNLFILTKGVGSIGNTQVLKMNTEGTLIWEKTYGNIENSSTLLSVIDGFVIQGKTYQKIDKNGEPKWHKSYTPLPDNINQNQVIQNTGFLVSIQNEQSNIKLIKSNFDGNIDGSCINTLTLDEVATNSPFLSVFFPSNYQYTIELEELSSPFMEEQTAETITNCFKKCEEFCSSFGANIYGEPELIEIPYCMLTMDDAILIGGRRNDRSFIMKMDTFGNVLKHWLFNFGGGNDYIQKMILTEDDEIIGYGDLSVTPHESDFYFKFNPLTEQIGWTRIHQLDGQVRFLDIEMHPPTGNPIIVGSQKIGNEELGLVLGIKSLNGNHFSPYSEKIPPQIGEKCFFTDLEFPNNQVNVFGGISSSIINDKLVNASIQSPLPSFLPGPTLKYANLSPKEIVEDVIDEGIINLKLYKSQKTTGTKCRHFLYVDSDFVSFDYRMIDFDIEFEENVAFELILIPPFKGILIAGNGNSGAKYLAKIDNDGNLEWAKEFLTDEPISFSLLEDKVYFSFAEYNPNTLKQDIVFGRMDLNGNVSGGCNFIQNFQPTFGIADPPISVNQSFGNKETIEFDGQSSAAQTALWLNLDYEIKCEKDCNEICDNQIDDDSDGLIDGFDPDCDCKISNACNPQSYLTCEDMPCEFSYDLSDIEAIQIDTLWSYPVSLEGLIPMVGDIDGDCIPDVVVHSGLAIDVLDSQDGSLKYSFPIEPMGPGIESILVKGQLAVGDVDLDGKSEIFFTVEYKLQSFPDGWAEIFRLDYNPQTNELEAKLPWGGNIVNSVLFSPSLADFDNNGQPEVYVGHNIFNVETGQLLANGKGNNTGNPPYFHKQSGSIAADVLSANDCQGCDGLELIAGNQVYAISIFSEFETAFNSMYVVRELPDMPDGYTQLADFDNDGDLDAIVASDTSMNPMIYVWDIQTETMIGKPNYYPSLSIGLPSIGDVDGDGWVEIVAPIRSRVDIYEDYQNGGGINWGEDPSVLKASMTTNYSSPYTSLPLFDINGDGKQEIFLSDVNRFGILDENLNWVSTPIQLDLTLAQHTGTYPVIADINGDGFTEILVKNDISIAAIRLNTPMPKTRPTWNQHNYHITNILDNGVIPMEQQKNHLPADGKLNGFRMQMPILNQDELPIFNLTEAALTDLISYCEEGQMVIEMEICNEGNSSIPSAVPISFYNGNPFNGDVEIIDILKSDTLIQPNECQIFQFEIPTVLNTPIFVFFNDNGSNNLPMSLGQDFPNSWMHECDFSNNFDEIILDFIPPELDLGNDTLICGTGVVNLNINSNFVNYLWQDGSEDSTFTTWLPGLFWVEVTDECGGIFRDSVLVEMLEILPVSNDSDTTICLGEGVTLNALSNFENIEWSPDALFECDTCFANTIFPDTTTQVIVFGQTADFCVNVDTILIEVIDLEIQFETTESCNGAPDGVITVEITNGLEPFDYQWNTTNQNTNSISNLLPGEYFLTITDARGCSSESSVFVEQTNTENIEIEVQQASCFGEQDGAISLNSVDESLQFSLNGSDFEKTNLFENLEAGTYSLFVLDSNNCITDTEIIVGQPDNLYLKLPDDLTIKLGEFYQINPITNASQNASFQWDDINSLDCQDCKTPIARPLETTTYSLEITDTTGCLIQDEITIFVHNSKRVYIPNAFSPNGDGFNDKFHPFGGSEVVQIRQFRIFDRWGNLLFEKDNFPPNDASFGWDGTFNNQKMNAAVYIFFAEIEYLDGELELIKGDVILMR